MGAGAAEAWGTLRQSLSSPLPVAELGAQRAGQEELRTGCLSLGPRLIPILPFSSLYPLLNEFKPRNAVLSLRALTQKPAGVILSSFHLS